MGSDGKHESEAYPELDKALRPVTPSEAGTYSLSTYLSVSYTGISFRQIFTGPSLAAWQENEK